MTSKPRKVPYKRVSTQEELVLKIFSPIMYQSDQYIIVFSTKAHYF